MRDRPHHHLYSYKLKSAFQGDIASLASFGNGLLPAANSVSFVTNHEPERNGRHLTYCLNRDQAVTGIVAGTFTTGGTQHPDGRLPG